MVSHARHPSSWETEVGESQVQCHLQLHQLRLVWPTEDRLKTTNKQENYRGKGLLEMKTSISGPLKGLSSPTSDPDRALRWWRGEAY